MVFVQLTKLLKWFKLKGKKWKRSQISAKTLAEKRSESEKFVKLTDKTLKNKTLLLHIICLREKKVSHIFPKPSSLRSKYFCKTWWHCGKTTRIFPKPRHFPSSPHSPQLEISNGSEYKYRRVHFQMVWKYFPWRNQNYGSTAGWQPRQMLV